TGPFRTQPRLATRTDPDHLVARGRKPWWAPPASPVSGPRASTVSSTARRSRRALLVVVGLEGLEPREHVGVVAPVLLVLAQIVDRFADEPLAVAVEDREVVARLVLVGVDADRLLELGDGVVELALEVEPERRADVGLGVLRVELPGVL